MNRFSMNGVCVQEIVGNTSDMRIFALSATDSVYPLDVTLEADKVLFIKHKCIHTSKKV